MANAAKTLRDDQDVDVNYYVLVPFTTVDAAEWAAGHIGTNFDCHVSARRRGSFPSGARAC